MKPVLLLLAGLLFLVGTMASHSAKAPRPAPASSLCAPESTAARHSAQGLSARLPELQRVETRSKSQVAETIGGLWMDVDRLQQQGENVRAIEYYLSDLEAGKRRGEQGIAASRHAANNLEYEIQQLNRRLGR